MLFDQQRTKRIYSSVLRKLKLGSEAWPYTRPVTELMCAARLGFTMAESRPWHEVVNNCPYGPAAPPIRPENELAHAWYEGFWFYHSTIKPWRELCQTSST